MGLAFVVAAVLVPGAVWFQDARAAANCLDRGGSYNYSTGQCDFVQSYEQIPFVSRHGVLFVASAIAFLVGAVLAARRGGNLPLLPFRAPAERRALLWCLGAGLVAIAFGVISIAGDQPLWLDVGAWNRRGREFWQAALILSLDVILVLVGCRGSRKLAIVVIAVFGSSLALLAGWGLFGSCVAALVHERVVSLHYLVAFGLMAAVQWYCLRAVIARL